MTLKISFPLSGNIYQILRYETKNPDELTEKICSLLAEALPWRPIEELYEGGYKYNKYDHSHDDEAGFLLLAPELVDLDCNVHGVGMGYYQDDGKLWPLVDADQATLDDARAKMDGNEGSFMACKWPMTNDEWSHVCCNPTHYLKLRGLNK